MESKWKKGGNVLFVPKGAKEKLESILDKLIDGKLAKIGEGDEGGDGMVVIGILLMTFKI